MKSFRSLKVWQLAHALTLSIYGDVRGFPDDERFGLTSQLRRASSSIPTNIAEGCGRSGDSEFRRFLDIALGSASELEYLLQLSCDLRLLPALRYEDLNCQTTQVKRMLTSLIRTLRKNRKH